MIRVNPPSDVLRPYMGAARDSHPDEFERILGELAESGVEVVFRSGQLAYSPVSGAPGRMILDPEASLAALRHEFQHFQDVRSAGYPGLSYYFSNLEEFARLESRGYEQELQLAKQLGQPELELAIRSQMQRRMSELLGADPP